MSLIDEIRSMSPEEKAELRAALEPPKPAPTKTVNSLDLRPRDERGALLTPEEIYDRRHPLEGIWAYGYSVTSQVMGQDPVVRYYTDQEVAAHNEPIIQDWLEEKRKHFPDAKRPSVPRV